MLQCEAVGQVKEQPGRSRAWNQWDERKLMNAKRIKLTPPILEAKNGANCEMRIFLATDETRMKHGSLQEDSRMQSSVIQN